MCEKRDIGGYAVAKKAKFGLFFLYKSHKNRLSVKKFKNEILCVKKLII